MHGGLVRWNGCFNHALLHHTQPILVASANLAGRLPLQQHSSPCTVHVFFVVTALTIREAARVVSRPKAAAGGGCTSQ
jgi:hypothetical protein